MKEAETKIAIFKDKKIRKTIYQKEWWFSVVDVVETLTGSIDPRDYWFKMKIRITNEDGLQLSTICRQLKLPAPDGKMREEHTRNGRADQTTSAARSEPASGLGFDTGRGRR